jgi:hypothetical protein
MTDRNLIDSIPRGGIAASTRKPLTADEIEAILATDEDIEPAKKRHLEERLGNLRHADEQRERTNALSAREIVDSIPRGLR